GVKYSPWRSFSRGPENRIAYAPTRALPSLISIDLIGSAEPMTNVSFCSGIAPERYLSKGRGRIRKAGTLGPGKRNPRISCFPAFLIKNLLRGQEQRHERFIAIHRIHVQLPAPAAIATSLRKVRFRWINHRPESSDFRTP